MRGHCWKFLALSIIHLAGVAVGLKHSVGNVLLMDHLNINHQKSRHDLLKAFYFDSLGLSIDPRKIDNFEAGRKTLWANAGITQFHLPEATEAQLFNGVITLSYPDQRAIHELYNRLSTAAADANCCLYGTKFAVQQQQQQQNDNGADIDSSLVVTDPWGNKFEIICNPDAVDERGVQPGTPSKAIAMSDLCIYMPEHSNLEGIARFYDRVLGAPSLPLQQGDNAVSIVTSPQQTLTFKACATATAKVSALKAESEVERDHDSGAIVVNNGPHISLYLRDLPTAYRRAEELGVLFVNQRFKRRAYSLDEAVEQCMFRCLQIVDPDAPEDGPIVQLEHEVRSATHSDGTRYKSCPFDVSSAQQ